MENDNDRKPGTAPGHIPFKGIYDAQEAVLEGKKRNYVPLKPLIAGILLLILTVFGLVFGMGLFCLPVIFAVPTFIAAMLVLCQRKHAWALLGGISSIVLGLNLRALSPVFFFMAVASLILIFLSEDEFED